MLGVVGIVAPAIAWLDDAHSSVAIVLLIMSFVLTGVVPLELGFALVLGANIGSGIVPLALTFTSGRAARRIPLGNLLFRAIGALAVLGVVGIVAPAIAWLDADPARQIANFHTAFNLALALVFLPFTGLMARLTERVFPEGEEEQGKIAPKYLDETAIGTPAVALACATREVLRMADIVEIMLRGLIDVFRNDDMSLAQRISKLDDEVDDLYESIKLYLTKMSRQALDEHDSRRCIELITFTTNLEHMGDIIDKNLLEIAEKKARNKLSFSEEGWQELVEMHSRVVTQMKLGMSLFVSGDLPMARKLLMEKERFRDLEREGSEQHLQRLRSGEIASIETSALHLDILRDLKRGARRNA